MSDRATVALAVAVFVGALHPRGLPWLPLAVAAVVLTALPRGRSIALVLIALLLASALSHRSWAHLDEGELGPVAGEGMLVSDPERWGPATVAVVEIDGHRYLASAWGGHAGAFGRLVAGERVAVEGTASLYRAPRGRRASLHVARRLALSRVERLDGGSLHWRVANRFRAIIEKGAADLDVERRGLFTGLVYGDDRAQDPVVASDFSVAGLTHLLAVSGQNVAYLIGLLGPLTGRLGPRLRLAALGAALLLFATATRFEPSVLRATFMAGLAILGRFSGREATGGRLLAMAVVGLVLLDPLLAESLAFRLSVAASAGLVGLARPISGALPGPQWIREPLGVTLAAQVAVAPLLISMFGPLSLVAIPANLLAGPAAGAVMAWGMTAGVVAGILPVVRGPAHLPTGVLLSWLETVARVSAGADVPRVALAWVSAAFVTVIGMRYVRPQRLRRRLGLVLVVALLAAAWQRPSGVHAVGDDSTVVLGPHAVVIVGQERSAIDLLDDLRALGVSGIAVAICTDVQGMDVLEIVGRRMRIGEILVGRPRPPATQVFMPVMVTAGRHRVLVAPLGNRLEATIVGAAGVGEVTG